MLNPRVGRRVALAVILLIGGLLAIVWDDLLPKRVRVLEPGRLVRGAWQRPGPLRRLIDRERIRTVVTLTAINRDDPKYVAQEAVVRATGVDWVIVPMRGSTATLDQLTEAADLLADPARQPVFFHCVGGHHRTGLVHAAYRIRHQGWSAAQAWAELRTLPWTRPVADEPDRRVIEAFAEREATHPPGQALTRRPAPQGTRDGSHEDSTDRPTDAAGPAAGGPGPRLADRLSPGHG